MLRITRIAVGLLPIPVIAVGILALGDREEPASVRARARRTPGIVQIEEDGLRYTYHLLSGTEALFDTRSDPRSLRNLLPERSGEGRRLRRQLERELEVPTLEDLRRERQDEIDDLKSLGYL